MFWDEFLPVNMRHDFNGGQPRAGMGDVRTQQFSIIGENLAALAPARNADVKLFLIDGGQRTRRRDDQNFIHRLALGGMGRDGVAMRECAIIFRNHPAIGQHNRIALNRPHLDEFAIDKLLAGQLDCSNSLSPAATFNFRFSPTSKQAMPAPNGKMLSEPSAR